MQGTIEAKADWWEGQQYTARLWLLSQEHHLYIAEGFRQRGRLDLLSLAKAPPPPPPPTPFKFQLTRNILCPIHKQEGGCSKTINIVHSITKSLFVYSHAVSCCKVPMNKSFISQVAHPSGYVQTHEGQNMAR